MRNQALDWKTLSFDQTIHADSPVQIPVIELQGLSDQELESKVGVIIRKMVAEPFDYANHPLLRVWLLRLAPADHTLLTIMPHIVSDAWSINIFMKELFRLYAAACNGTSADLHVAQFQYADFAGHQHLRNQELRQKVTRDGERGRKGCVSLEVGALRFLQERRKGVIGLSHAEAGHLATWFDPKYCNSLREMAGRFKVTVSMFVFTCYGALLHLASGLNRFSITITQANRTHPDLLNVFGFVASGQLICCDYSGNPTISDMCRQVRSEFSEAVMRYEFVGAPPTRHGVGCELLAEFPAADVPGLSIERFKMLAKQHAEFGLKLVVHHTPTAGIEMAFEYCVDCFTQNVIQAFLDCMKEMIGHIVKNPKIRVPELAVFVEQAIASTSNR
jgi:hypothetical protein